MTGIGHNKGPSMEPGAGFRRHAWAKARRDLIPSMPLEVINMRMRRARALGLDFKTYATVRATTGRDIIGFLFSTNALRLLRPGDTLPQEQAAHLRPVAVDKHIGLAGVSDPMARDAAAKAGIEIAGTHRLPGFTTPWSGLREDMKSWLRSHGYPGDGVIMIGETPFEREIAGAGGLAGFLTGERYFAGASKT